MLALSWLDVLVSHFTAGVSPVLVVRTCDGIRFLNNYNSIEMCIYKMKDIAEGNKTRQNETHSGQKKENA